MNPAAYVLILLASLPGSALGEPEETPVKITPEVAGSWIQPAGNWGGRTVLMLHGLADDMNGPADSTKHLAMSLARMGVATLRINFRGEGDRLRTKIESTLYSRVEDTENAYRFLTQRDGVAGGKIGVYGSSLGATTAIVTASRHPGWFTTLAVWSSPSGDQGPGMMEGALKDAAREAMATGAGSFHFEGWKTVTFKRDFFESFAGVDLDAALAKIPGAFLTVRGTEDFLPVRDREMVSLSGGNPRESVLIGGADHIFNVFDPEKDYHQRAIAATVEWFIRTLNASSEPN